ncbi:MAG: PadR family transcriptional regulator [Planctomycetota bacterium]|nr:PadR family transcriptional regulator [Planctomycetota bacterium]
MELTELEHVALAVIWRDGPCTPYHVRKQFLDSPTPRWSGSAGALYPLMRRIEEQGLVTSQAAGDDGRGTRHYKVTPAGRGALVRWLRPPLDATAIGPIEDPIRTRLLFVGALSPAARRKFLDGVTRQLAEHVAELQGIEEAMRVTQDPLLLLAARGSHQVARARQRWFRDVCATLGQPSAAS